MADIQVSEKSGRRKTHSLRVDLTPMVDLGFLLITFFMYTTTLAKNKLMEINRPSGNVAHPTVYPEESTVTLIPVGFHKIIYYPGTLYKTEWRQIGYSGNSSVRNILMAKEKQVAGLPNTLSAQAHQLHVVIKPDSDCSYSDIVALLDEMHILDIQYYALTDITAEEKDLLSKNSH